VGATAWCRRPPGPTKGRAFAVSDALLSELAGLIEQNAGNVVPESHFPFLDRILLARVRAVGLDGRKAYLEALREGRLEGEWAQLLPQITIKESYLFRTPQQFVAIEALLPRLLEVRAAERRLAVWSAGCAHGEEAATLAVVLAEQAALAGWDWRIVATDVDEVALAAARRCTFAGRAMARVPAAYVERWFVPRGAGFQLHPELRSRIEFRAANLVQEPYPFTDVNFALVFLRNVLIYFRPELQRQVVTSVVRRLAPDGVLFVGPSESLWQLGLPLAPLELDGCFGYTRASAGEGGPRRGRSLVARGPEPRSRSGPAGRAPVAGGGGGRGGVATPQRAVAGRESGEVVTAPASASSTPVRAAVASSVPHLVAAALADGRLAAAAAALATALAVEPTNAPLRAFEGLRFDLESETEAALRAYRAALFLDPELFQVRLLCADLLRRGGDVAAAQRHYREALRTLGGGGGRELPGTGTLLPDREAARRRCEAALRGASGGV
jgi:chemotaxis protein methyltransferase CheR